MPYDMILLLPCLHMKKWKVYFYGLCIEECRMGEIGFLRFILFDMAKSLTETRVIKIVDVLYGIIYLVFSFSFLSLQLIYVVL